MHDSFMRRAIALAVENVRSGGGGPFGAVIVKDGRVVAEGVNRVTPANDPTAHAEIVAIREACRALGRFQLQGCQVYASCEPCPMCLGAIYWARLDRLYFAASRDDAAEAGFDDARIHDALTAAPDARTIPVERLLQQEAWKAFEQWKQKADRIDY
ncbi:MAG TPA: nucleoside deaminase [Bryobacteraceae bacterium]|nr:nucleoside deaminase [Bryobacteraceae bacterium]